MTTTIKVKTKKRKTVYKKCTFLPDIPSDLQAVLTSALSKASTVGDRLEALDAEAQQFRFIADFKNIDGLLCGVLLTFERGSSQPIIKDDPTANALLVDAMLPPKNGGQQHQFVPGVLYFCIYGNHVVLIQSAALRATGIEQHFAWLLRSKYNEIDSKIGLALVDKVEPATDREIQKKHVRRLSLGRSLMDDPFVVDEPYRTKGGRDKVREVKKMKADKNMLDAFANMMPSVNWAKMGIADQIFTDDLEVWINISYSRGRKPKSNETIKLMDSLALAFRDVDEDSIELELGDRSVVKGSQLKIISEITHEVNNKGIADLTSIYKGMTDWLRALKETSKIQD